MSLELLCLLFICLILSCCPLLVSWPFSSYLYLTICCRPGFYDPASSDSPVLLFMLLGPCWLLICQVLPILPHQPYASSPSSFFRLLSAQSWVCCLCCHPLLQWADLPLATHLWHSAAADRTSYRNSYLASHLQPMTQHQWSQTWGCTIGLPLHVRLFDKVCDNLLELMFFFILENYHILHSAIFNFPYFLLMWSDLLEGGYVHSLWSHGM